jgi:hypothetical protein
MILVNLLPDLRQAKLKEQRRRQLISGISILIWAVCGGIVVLMLLYVVGQKAYISDATSKIKNKQNDLRAMPDLIPALTAQQHLSSLSNLYAKRVYLSKFFNAYMQADPVDVSISSLTVDANNVLSVHGQAPTYAEVAKVIRALEACNVKVCAGATPTSTPYFSNVAASSVESSQKGRVDFTVTASLSPGVTSNVSQ